MGYLEDKILNSLVEKRLVWWRYIDLATQGRKT